MSKRKKLRKYGFNNKILQIPVMRIISGFEWLERGKNRIYCRSGKKSGKHIKKTVLQGI